MRLSLLPRHSARPAVSLVASSELTPSNTVGERSTSSAEINLLPPELLLLVFECRQERDVPSVRLVCKTFAYTGEPFLLCDIHADFREKSSRKLPETTCETKLGVHAYTVLLDPASGGDKEAEWCEERIEVGFDAPPRPSLREPGT